MKRGMASFSLEELMAELARRRVVDGADVPPEPWCHDCGRFKTWDGTDEPPADFNCCTKGHAMKFRAPEDYGDEWGFYRRICRDRLNDTEEGVR